jgi:hypothetical protein
MVRNNNGVEERMSELINIAKNEYDLVVNMTEIMYEVKEVFSFAKYKVETLLSAPVASKIEDMPTDFTTSHLDALYEAYIAVIALRNIIDTVMCKYFNIDDTIISSVVSEDIEHNDTVDTPTNKRMKIDRTFALCEIEKNSSEEVCESYEKARHILIREMKKYEKMIEKIVANTVPKEDDMVFNVRGELMTYSRVSLVNTTNTGRTYFDGLLNGNWKTDAIGMLTVYLLQLLAYTNIVYLLRSLWYR